MRAKGRVRQVNSHNGTGPVHKAVLLVHNLSGTGFYMSDPVVDMWSTPSPARKIQGDGCYNSSLSAGYGAACYGTAVKLSTVCQRRPDARAVTANVAVSIGGVRYTPGTEPRAVNC